MVHIVGVGFHVRITLTIQQQYSVYLFQYNWRPFQNNALIKCHSHKGCNKDINNLYKSNNIVIRLYRLVHLLLVRTRGPITHMANIIS